jgi:hypothetical protein
MVMNIVPKLFLQKIGGISDSIVGHLKIGIGCFEGTAGLATTAS